MTYWNSFIENNWSDFMTVNDWTTTKKNPNLAGFCGGQVTSGVRMGMSNDCDDVSSSFAECPPNTSFCNTTLSSEKAHRTLSIYDEEAECNFRGELGENEAEAVINPSLPLRNQNPCCASAREQTNDVSTLSCETERPTSSTNGSDSNNQRYHSANFFKSNSSTTKSQSPSSTGTVYGGNSSFMNNAKIHSSVFKNHTVNTSWPSEPSTSRGKSTVSVPLEEERLEGDVGLANIGNTCFLNSGLQCLVHTGSLVEYFLNTDFKLTLSTGIALEFQNFIQQAWLGIEKAIYLTSFKNKLGECHSQFKDTRQHDCQEFLALMLDTLHEQLKAVKPRQFKTIESCLEGASHVTNGHKREGVDIEQHCIKKSNKRQRLNHSEDGERHRASEGELELSIAATQAEDYWNKYLSSNRTVIASTFQGLFKSSVICEECKYVSVTYEPFMYLSIPIPRVSARKVSVHFVSRTDRRPIQVPISIMPDLTVERLKKLVAKEIQGLPTDPISLHEFVVAEIVNNNIARRLNDDMQLSYLNDSHRNVYMYELNTNFAESYGKTTNMLTLHGLYSSSSPQNSTLLKKPCTLQPFVRASVDSDEDWDAPTQMNIPHLVPSLSTVPDSSSTSNHPALSPSVILSDSDVDHILPPTSSTSRHFVADTTVQDPAGIEGVLNPLQSLIIPPSAFPLTEEDEERKLTCLVCLEDIVVSVLSKHKICGAVMCQDCIVRAADYYQKDNHEEKLPGPANGNYLKCPRCIVVMFSSEFVPYNAEDTTLELNLVGILFRLPLDSNNNSSRSAGRLFGAPLLVRIPSTVRSEDFYSFIADINPFPELDARVVNVFAEGTNCATCSLLDCDGCEIPKDGIISIPSGTAVAVSYTSISRESVASVEPGDMAIASPVTMSFTPQPEAIVDIHDCLRAFSEVEHLDEQNPWNCPECQKKTRATKTMTICRFPDYLIIHLKRFIFMDQMSCKLSNKLKFPLYDLEMNPYIAPEVRGKWNNDYDLYSCVCHYGSASNGHYVAFSKNPLTMLWSQFNDSVVTVDQAPSEREFTTAYVLFYQRKKLQYNIRKRTEETVIRTPPSSMVNRPATTTSILPILSSSPAALAMDPSWAFVPITAISESSYVSTMDKSSSPELKLPTKEVNLNNFPHVSSTQVEGGFLRDSEHGCGDYELDISFLDGVQARNIDRCT